MFEYTSARRSISYGRSPICAICDSTTRDLKYSGITIDDHPIAKCDMMENEIAKEEEKLLDLVAEGASETLINEWYTENASLYEQTTQFYHYQEECLKMFKEYVTQRDCSIIDFAMGTGTMGDLLKDAGYTGRIDGVDRNKAMTDIAKSKNVYTNVWNTAIGHDKMSFVDDETYDHGVATGCLGRGHIPITAIPTLIRTIKKGGHLVFTLAWHHLRFEESTVEAIKNYCSTWDSEGLCHLVSYVQAAHSKSGDCHVFVLQRGSKDKP